MDSLKAWGIVLIAITVLLAGVFFAMFIIPAALMIGGVVLAYFLAKEEVKNTRRNKDTLD